MNNRDTINSISNRELKAHPTPNAFISLVPVTRISNRELKDVLELTPPATGKSTASQIEN